jgi:hypothetical protein
MLSRKTWDLGRSEDDGFVQVAVILACARIQQA